MAGLTNWEKCRLLLWKNWLLQWNVKRSLLFELFLPVVFFVLMVLLRDIFLPVLKESTEYSALNIDNIDLFRQLQVKSKKPIEYKLVYSPENLYLENIVKLAFESLNLTGYQSYPNKAELEEALIEGNFLAGIQFEDIWWKLNDYPKNFSFTLRFPSELRTAAGSLTWLTMKLFMHFDLRGPRNHDDNDGGVPVGYLREGFLPVQNALTMSYIKLVTGNEDLPHIVMQRYPYAAYISDPLLEAFTMYLSLCIVLGFIYPATSMVRYVTAEKEKQLKEVMKIMGLSNWIHWIAWFLKAFTTLGTSVILIVVLMKLEWKNHMALLTKSTWSVLLFLLLVYITASIWFCFMLAIFFSKATTAVAFTGLVWVIGYIPFMEMKATYDSFDLFTKLGWCLLPNTALGFAIQLVLEFEGIGEGLQWHNLFTPVNIDDDLTVGYVILIMLSSSILYMCICLYVEQIFPGKYGVPRKWNFIFKRKIRRKRRKYGIEQDLFRRKNPDAFESIPIGHPIGIKVINMKKKFGNKMAVNGLSMNMYEDEITVLLGHDGAGKTTTISMLTGMFPPTSGTAIIIGCDIRTNTDGARTSMGICPQHNVLFDELTVTQHLLFFNRLKGLNEAAIQHEVDRYIRLMELNADKNVAAKYLSGGMKRKLSVCCALTGNAKIVLLDEPSSGMDPSARRQLWDLLQGEKRGRTILLTTHFMDEADYLGDRIAIMCDGGLKCYGTPFFLKKKYGSGYRLICVKRNGCNSDEVTNLLQQYIPDLKPEREIGTELSYLLSSSYSSQFEEMLDSLENNSDDLRLNGYGISITSMEEVFMKVGAENSHDDAKINSDSDESDDIESITPDRLFSDNLNLLKGVKLLFNQWHAIMLKKILNTYSNKLLFVLKTIIPLLFVSILFVSHHNEGIFKPLQPIAISLTQYPQAVIVLETATDVVAGSLQQRISDKYHAIATSYGSNYEFCTTGNQSFSSFILDMRRNLQVRINARYVASATITNNKITAWLNNQPLHTAPLTVNLVHNAMIKALLNDSYEITVTNAPLPYTTDMKLTRLMIDNLGNALAVELCFTFCFVSTFFIFFSIKDRQSRSKLLQFMAGVNVWIFWLTQFLWDIISYGITAVIVIICIGFWQEFGFSSYGQLARYLLILILFGCSAIPLTYLVSFFFSDPATGFIRLSIINIFDGVVLFLIVINLPLKYKYITEKLKWIFRIFPHFSLAMGLRNLYVNVATREACGAETVVMLPDASRCEWFPKCCTIVPFFDWAEPGVLPEIVYFSITTVVFLLLIIAREQNIFTKFCRRNNIEPPPPLTDLEEDVAKENRYIRYMSSTDLKATNLVLDRVTKYYGNFIAVNQVSLCVKPNECFGLLGVNGAGKTTTFKMMTGDEPITFGAAYVKGIKVTYDMNQIHQQTGYCPQFDGLFVDYTGRQTLKIFCLLVGIQRNRVYAISEELATLFGFKKHLDKKIKNYSGGNKRKLSAAIAVIGSPSIIYLDEPTTGMDPASRRQLWNIICRLRDSGKSIVLTSHSMEECEALCTRLAIMVNGEFKCIGSTQHLKNKFSKGLVMKIKLKRQTNSKESMERFFRPRSRTKPRVKINVEMRQSKHTKSLFNDYSRAFAANRMITDIRNVKRFVDDEFPEALLKEEFQGILTYHIPLTNIKWSRMFGVLERNRENLNIEDYSISQTTLEEIFLQFAQQQRENKRLIK